MAEGLLGSCGKNSQTCADAAEGRHASGERTQALSVGAEGFYLFTFLLGDQDLISSPSLGLSFPTYTSPVESHSCLAHSPELFSSVSCCEG